MPDKSMRIVLTGGGTAGHVIPALALVEHLQAMGFSLYYIGSKNIEKDLVAQIDLPFHEIPAGKLRRYWSWRNITDLGKIFFGFIYSLIILVRIRPKLVFSKGGFVAVPVAFAAKILRIPIITHESDFSPGLATRLVSLVAEQVLCAFSETTKYMKGKNIIAVGTPIRSDIFSGDRTRGLEFLKYHGDKAILLIVGGSLGAQRINDIIVNSQESLFSRYFVVHITGKGKEVEIEHPNYRNFEFLSHELPDVLAASDFVVSRAGANAIFEFAALRKPMLLIPLVVGSRGDQVQNASFFESEGWALVADEQNLTPSDFIEHLEELQRQGKRLSETLEKTADKDVAQNIANIILRLCSERH
jgi:UDP-N-acetylglucosamine--N-acetylmuramyl-(pentapeptide) pyrophosphoryl-undecaprenol N-acetylglucosamine transferase